MQQIVKKYLKLKSHKKGEAYIFTENLNLAFLGAAVDDYVQADGGHFNLQYSVVLIIV